MSIVARHSMNMAMEVFCIRATNPAVTLQSRVDRGFAQWDMLRWLAADGEEFDAVIRGYEWLNAMDEALRRLQLETTVEDAA